MTPEILTIPCRADNYAFLVHDPLTGGTALFDAPEAAPIAAALAERGWRLTDIVLTHHHDDHVAAVPALRAGARVIGGASDAHRLPPLDLAVGPGDVVEIVGQATDVIDVSGHTVGHLAFHMPGAGAAFTGDSLMALGCGRLFEGTAAMMWQSMLRLRALPPETLICSGHEYTASNARFAASLEPDRPALISRIGRIDSARAAGRPTVPSRLSEELETNPYLRADDPELGAAIGLSGAAPEAVFAEIRGRKDRF